ncbi:MarR family transcriptional regulator [Robbsia sp. KACC 23696]|uniref:MarR family winged helix-turn-helix transcriptional regulator n=1 Tax=Robbsia sp. KACC 23696 TaxID=3149231 RepID=UPI00325B64DB
MISSSFSQSVTDFMQSIGMFLRRMRSMPNGDGLSMTEAIVLSRLAHDGPATIAALARAEGMKPQSMGTTIAALEDAALVVRTAHPTDGRQMLIGLTENGVQRRAQQRARKQLWLEQAIKELSEEERDTLFRAAGIIRKLAVQ